MARRKNVEGRFEVTGPGIDDVICLPDAGAAISRSITAASVHNGEGTWYVRDADGTPIGYSERDKLGVITIRRTR